MGAFEILNGADTKHENNDKHHKGNNRKRPFPPHRLSTPLTSKETFVAPKP